MYDGGEVYSYKDSNATFVNIALYLKTGIDFEDAKQIGISHLLEHMFFRHLSDLSQSELYLKIDEMGTDLNACTYRHGIVFNMSVLPEHVVKAASLFQKIFDEPQWSNDEINREKCVVKNQIIADSYSPYRYEIKKNVYKDSFPWNQRIMGSCSTVERISRGQLLKWYSKTCDCSNAAVAVSGDFSEEDLNLIIHEFTKIEPAKMFMQNIHYECSKLFMRTSDSDKIISAFSDYSQVCICFDIPKSCIYQAKLLNIILSSGCTSILSRLLTDELGICEYIDSYTDDSLEFSNYFIEFSVKTSNLSESMTEVSKKISSFKNGISKERFDNAKTFYLLDFKKILSNPANLNDTVFWHRFFIGENIHSILEIERLYSDISFESFQRMVQKTLIPKNMVITVKSDGNKNMIRRGLLNLGRN